LNKTVRRHVTIPVPAAALFSFLSDHSHAEVFIEGLERLSPLGAQTSGEGAQFEAVLKVGVSSFLTTIVIAGVEPERSITWSSVGNGSQSLAFDLSPRDDGTEVDLAITYEEPGGLAGALVAPFIERTVEHRAETSLERLRGHFSPAE